MAVPLRLFLAGDVMTGRGVDQIQKQPSLPALQEPFVRDAGEYVRLAEQVSGAVPRGVAPDYIWGDAVPEWARLSPAARIVNLETSITRSEAYDRQKGIHYRMHPGNAGCLTAAGIDVCVLANNHVLDYGQMGLLETLESLRRAGISAVGAGRNQLEARRPLVRGLPDGTHLIVGACGHVSSGIPQTWAAAPDRPGVWLLSEVSSEAAADLAAQVTYGKVPGDLVVVSIHWGDNWGYEVPTRHVAFARRLIDGGVDLVHGHSSHHPRPIEIYRGKLILYGCGDFIDDYEGISGHESYRDDLVLMYFPLLDPSSGKLVRLDMTPLRIRRLRLNRVTSEEARWMADTVGRTSAAFGTQVTLAPGGALSVAPSK